MRRSGILNFLASFVALLVAAFFAFLVSLFVAFFLSLFIALGVSFRISAIIGVGRRRRRRRWWRNVIGIGRWIVTGSENAARRIIINKGTRKIEGSGKKERVQDYSGSQSTKECGRYKACGKNGSHERNCAGKARSHERDRTRETVDENDSVSKTRSDESDATRKTGSD